MVMNPTQDEVTATLMRTSIQMPEWMWARLGEIAERTLSSRAQVIRRLVAEGLAREPSPASTEAVV